jgi:hypothetical protein
VVEGLLHGLDSACLMGCRREARTARHAGGNSEAIGVVWGVEDDAEAGQLHQ